MPTTTTSFLTGLICILVTIIGILGWWFRRRSYRKGIPTGPVTLLAPAATISLGIFGTFLGIYLGLRNFDTADINSSIPELLEGLKTAFITSLFGMFASLALKYIYGDFDRRELTKLKGTSEDPIILLRNIVSVVKSVDSNIHEIGKSIISCFKSEEEYSLLSQLKLIRTDMTDLRREITQSLREFGEKVAELGTEAMIKALREVIEQFNAKLNDLVGAEFKQLKEEMLKLVEWQENYKTSVDSMQRKIEEYLVQLELTKELLLNIGSSMEKSASHIENIDSSLSGLSVSAKDIDTHIKSLKLQNEQLEGFIKSIKDLGQEAKNVVPEFTKHINEATGNLESTAKTVGAKFLEITGNLGNETQKIGNEIKRMTENHSSQVDKSIDQIQKQLERALTASLNSLAGQLASLSAKFVEDYSPLTERLRQIVRIAEGSQNA